jgi:predicted amidohydrolase YtcJ
MNKRSVSLRSPLQFLIVLLMAGGCAAQQTTNVPDMVLIKGHVFTGTPERPFAEAIALKGQRIVAVGTSQEISSMAGPATRVIDVAGHLVIPGINDSHLHFQEDPIGTKVDFGSMEPTCAHVLELLRQAATKVPRGTLISGTIGPEAFFDPACTAAALDRVAPGDAVVLGTWSPHAGILNQAAAKRFGIDTSAPPPLAGWYGKDLKSQHWDGVVHQGAWFRIFDTLMSEPSGQEAKLRRLLQGEARWGITSITLIELHPALRVAQLSAINAPLRVRLVPALAYQEQNRRRKPEYPPVPAQLADRVTVSGEKWLLDSGTIERSGAMRAPYADNPTNSGQIDFPVEEMRAILEEARQRNRQLLLHAVGDRTIETLLTLMEETGGARAWAQQRLRIEHGDGLMPDLIPRAKRLGLIVVQNPMHFTLGELFLRRLGPERLAIFQPFRSLFDAGIPLVIASDGVTDTPLLNPYANIMLATAYPGKPQQSLTRLQALKAYTETAAYAEFAEDSKGRLEPGKLADLAVLSQDILQVPSEDLPKTESLLTIVGGKVAYASGPFVALRSHGIETR